MKCWGQVIFIQVFFFYAWCSNAHVNSAWLEEYLANDAQLKKISLQNSAAVKEFYKIFQYKPAWIEHSSRTQKFVQLLFNLKTWD
ncbi:MAG TPA: hypothetical protein VET23_08685 [Chitinophagaceae bacterium]|nr:hypothetical protein [Chitinophagaceae bacterium]